MRHIIGKLGGYFCTAGAAAVIDIGGFVALIQAGLSVLAAATSSFLTAMVFNYLATSRWVFKKSVRVKTFLIFAAASLMGMTVNVTITAVAMASFHVPAVLAKIVGVGVSFLVNFAVNYGITFKTREP
jgi:putative flippase GtrA